MKSTYGVTTEEMARAIKNFPWPPFDEMDIRCIEANPNLSWFQKWKLINKIKKEKKIRWKN